MTSRTRRITRIVFAAVGTLAYLLGIGTLTLLAVLHRQQVPAGITNSALRGTAVYLGIGAVCTYAFVRLKRCQQSAGT
jgi:hypothetical protein